MWTTEWRMIWTNFVCVVLCWCFGNELETNPKVKKPQKYKSEASNYPFCRIFLLSCYLTKGVNSCHFDDRRTMVLTQRIQCEQNPARSGREAEAIAWFGPSNWTKYESKCTFNRIYKHVTLKWSCSYNSWAYTSSFNVVCEWTAKLRLVSVLAKVVNNACICDENKYKKWWLS